MAERRFWRIVRSNPPGNADFLSNEAKGMRSRADDPDTLHLWWGISMFATQAQARRLAHRVPALGTFLAELRLRDDPSVRVEQTLGRGRYTLWGDADRLLASVIRVVPIEGQTDGNTNSAQDL